mmetsp:Transcript_46431/g.85029  ORF Transcript_46431/g.85029 Transcript_46431/m.85029 type:complete len:355 (-) Transcript_46431:87-1151(-)
MGDVGVEQLREQLFNRFVVNKGAAGSSAQQVQQAGKSVLDSASAVGLRQALEAARVPLHERDRERKRLAELQQKLQWKMEQAASRLPTPITMTAPAGRAGSADVGQIRFKSPSPGIADYDDDKLTRLRSEQRRLQQLAHQASEVAAGRAAVMTAAGTLPCASPPQTSAASLPMASGAGAMGEEPSRPTTVTAHAGQVRAPEPFKYSVPFEGTGVPLQQMLGPQVEALNAGPSFLPPSVASQFAALGSTAVASSPQMGMERPAAVPGIPPTAVPWPPPPTGQSGLSAQCPPPSESHQPLNQEIHAEPPGAEQAGATAPKPQASPAEMPKPKRPAHGKPKGHAAHPQSKRKLFGIF